MSESIIVKEFAVPSNIGSSFMREKWSYQTFIKYVSGVSKAADINRTSAFDTMTGHTATYTKDGNIYVLTSIQPKKDNMKMLISKKVYPANVASVMDKIKYNNDDNLTHSPFKKLKI